MSCGENGKQLTTDEERKRKRKIEFLRMSCFGPNFSEKSYGPASLVSPSFRVQMSPSTKCTM